MPLRRTDPALAGRRPQAEDAEDYAEFMIALAYSTIEESEYAALEAVLARQDADEARTAVS